MTENEFISAIDCRFPYADTAAASALIVEACALGPNAAFAVADELARPPRGAATSVASRLELLGQLRRRLAHPIAATVLAVAERMVRGHELTVPEAVAALDAVAAFPGMYAALGLVVMSCDDADGDADRRYEDIVESWRSQSPA